MPDAWAATLLAPWLADVQAERAPARPPARPTASGLLWTADAETFALQVPGVARYAAVGGRRLSVEPEPGTPDELIARHARMAPTAALCHQRGLVPLHAAAARCGARTILLAGDSASGKSTLLAGLAAAGWEPLADELAVLSVADDRPVVLPVPAPVHLWPDAQEQLPPPRPIASLAAGEELALGEIWWLTTHGAAEVQQERVRDLDVIEAVGRLTYNAELARALLDAGANLAAAAAAARHAAVVRLRRPRGRWTVDHLVDAIASFSARREVASG